MDKDKWIDFINTPYKDPRLDFNYLDEYDKSLEEQFIEETRPLGYNFKDLHSASYVSKHDPNLEQILLKYLGKFHWRGSNIQIISNLGKKGNNRASYELIELYKQISSNSSISEKDKIFICDIICNSLYSINNIKLIDEYIKIIKKDPFEYCQYLILALGKFKVKYATDYVIQMINNNPEDQDVMHFLITFTQKSKDKDLIPYLKNIEEKRLKDVSSRARKLLVTFNKTTNFDLD